ncbi:Hint domain-containing protein [Lichenicoccus sp.]|uniref:Hint domain-containing protein n=1 Tax=Lichenicoccus sp. TaxID=2781899 RepID=UPI003D0C0E90
MPLASDIYTETTRTTTGPYAGDYLFSTLTDWSGGAAPNSSTTAVTLNLLSGSTIAVDDAAVMGTLTYNNGGSPSTLLIGGSLTATTLATLAANVTTTVAAGGSLDFTGATTEFGLTNTVNVSGTLTASALSFATQTGTASNITVNSGGTLTAASLDLSGVAGTTIQAGGSLVETGILTLNGDTLSIAGTANIGTLELKSGSLAITGQTKIAYSGTDIFAINKGGSLEITGAINSLTANDGPSTFNIDGGTVKLDATVSLANALAATFNFGSSVTYGGGSFWLGNAAITGTGTASTFGYAITGVMAGDSFEVGTQKYTSASYAGHVLTLTGPGQTLTLGNVTGTALTSASFSLSTAADGGTTVTVSCFLAGTRIETRRGEIAIEALAEGDEVVTLEAGMRGSSRVRWLGHSVIDAAVGGEQAAPIRIRAHAFAPDQPRRDLLVTPEHCILVEGGLIPARMLVNGASILREPGLGRYEVHHVECERHVILFADGLTTESYLDTGTSGNFGTQDRAAADWTADAAAPLTTARAIVEPIWRRLCERAGAASPVRAVDHADDPDLRLRLQDGSVVRARNRRGPRHFFVLPAGTASTTLLSRSGVPAEIEGPFVDDRRQLGVQVTRALLWTGLATQSLPLADGRRRGWHASETAATARWTDGQAELGLPAILQRPAILEIELAGIAFYAPHHHASRPAA